MADQGMTNPTGIEGLHDPFSLAAQTSDARVSMKWLQKYWLYAATLPIVLYTFDALKVLGYWTARAPNVNMPTQLLLSAIFYGIWILVPYLVWRFCVARITGTSQKLSRLVLQVGALGLIVSAVHMMVLSVIWRVMFFPVDNPHRGPIHWVHTFGEIWLEHAGLWLLAYGITASVILFVLLQSNPTKPKIVRFEVRQNGKTWSIPYGDIFWFKAMGNYTELHTQQGVLTVKKSLSQVLKEVAGNQFLQSHRSALINGRHIIAIKPGGQGSGFTVQLSNGEEAPLSRRKLTHFRDVLKTID